MAVQKPSKKTVQQIIDRWFALGGPDKCSIKALSADVNIPRQTVSGWLNDLAKEYGLQVPVRGEPVITLAPSTKASAEDELKHQVATLKTQLTAYQKEELTARYVRAKIMGLAETTPTPPAWLAENKATKSSPGVPTLFASD